MERESRFWNGVHRKRLVVHLGDGNFDVCTRGFRSTPDFLKNFQDSKSYLDIGPGFGHAILKSDAPNKGVADISLEAIKNIQEKERSIEGHLIYDPAPASKYDLAPCISVVQHCDELALRCLMNFAHTALDRGGTLYIEGIYMRDKSDRGHNYNNTMAGSHMWNREIILNLWPGKCIYNHVDILDEHTGVWWMGLRKDSDN